MPEIIPGTRDIFLEPFKQCSLPVYILLPTTTANCISKINAVVPYFDKADSHIKERVVMAGKQFGTL